MATSEFLKQTVITLSTLIFFLILGALLGGFVSYLIFGSIYHAVYPGPVTNSHECARGMFAGFCALIGGVTAGSSLGSFWASKVLFQLRLRKFRDSPIEYALTKAEWETELGRRLRASSHYGCAGGVVIFFSGLGTPTTAQITIPLGLLFLAVGGVAFIRAHILTGQQPPKD